MSSQRKPRSAFGRLIPFLLLLAFLFYQQVFNRADHGGGETGGQPQQQAQPANAFSVLAGSELKDVEPQLVEAARQAGVALRIEYAGTLDIVERINGGEAFDALLPPNGAYPALALHTPPAAREKLFYSRVALGVKESKARQLGWLQAAPTWAQIASAAGSGQLRYAMTNPSSSNTGMSALFAVASAVAGKTEDLQVQEVDAGVLKNFLRGQKLTAGSSGWLADAFEKNPQPLDAIVNYEAVILRLNASLPASEQLVLIYPQDGVITADYPLMLLNAGKREVYQKLVAAFKEPGLQQRLSEQAWLRPSTPQARASAALPSLATAELSFPNSLDVIDEILSAYQGEWRRPATSIFVLDTSGSMSGQRIEQVRAALKVLAGADAQAASARYARFQNREHVVLISFASEVRAPEFISFAGGAQQQARAHVIDYANALQADGGTAIYQALLAAQSIARTAQAEDPERYVSIVLLSDGENTVGPKLGRYLRQVPAGQGVRVFPILFGESNNEEMQQLAAHTAGRVFDGRKAALAQVFKEIRGYQ